MILLAMSMATMNADAQLNLGGLGKKVKEKVKEKVSKVDQKIGTNSSSNSTLSLADVAQGVKGKVAIIRPVHKVPCPQFMAKDDTYDSRMARAFLERIGYIQDKEEIIRVGDSLKARAHEDSLELARLKPLCMEMSHQDRMAYDELEQELKRYNGFLHALGDYSTRFYFDGKIADDMVGATVNNVSVRLAQTTTYARCDNDKWYFYSIDGDKIFLEEEDLQYVYADIRRYSYIGFFLEGQTEKELREVYAKAGYCFEILRNAAGHNSVDNIEYQPYPKGGPLNGLAAKALASAKKSESYKDAIAVVIDAPQWTVDYNLGNPVRRKAGGWVIKNTKYGKKAYRAQFSEDYMGGGKYGEIHLYGIGGGQHYVK